MRVSSMTQAQEGDSIPAQKDALRKYIDSHDDMILAGEYCDDGVSGTRDDRDELQRLLTDVKSGKIDMIIVTKLDRLYRSIRHYLNLQDTLDSHGVYWLAIWEPIYDTSTPQGRLIINQMMSIAQFESENTGQRIRQVQSYKVSKGEVISGSTPPGYSIVDKHLVPNEHADAVRDVFKHYSLTGNLHETMRYAAAYGVFPSTSSAFHNILSNKTYIGQKRNNDNRDVELRQIEIRPDNGISGDSIALVVHKRNPLALEELCDSRLANALHGDAALRSALLGVLDNELEVDVLQFALVKAVAAIWTSPTLHARHVFLIGNRTLAPCAPVLPAREPRAVCALYGRHCVCGGVPQI